MDRRSLLAVVFSAATMSVIAGVGYIADCRVAGGDVDKCWLTGLPIAGLGGTAGGAFQLGYETLNPRLKRPEDEGK
jgi:hypothetical protein